MAGKREKPEDIVTKLRQVEVLHGQGLSMADAVRQIGISQHAFYRSRKQYGGMNRGTVVAAEGAREGDPEAAADGVRPEAREADPDRGCPGKLLSPSRRRKCVEHVCETLGISERRACRVLGQHRSTQRKPPQCREDEERLTADVIELGREYGRYDHRRVAVLLRRAGWQVNHKRVARIWRSKRLKVPHKQTKRGRLWLGDGSCVRLKPEHPNHVWSYDFVQDRTSDSRAYRTLNILDEYTRVRTH